MANTWLRRITAIWIAMGIAILVLTPRPVLASDVKTVAVHATGQIISQTFCGAALVCQVTTVSGLATRVGRFDGVLNEQVNILTGEYSGAGTFTTVSGDTITTAYIGQVTPPAPDGSVIFVENHQVTGGTGQFQGAGGALQIVGSADAAGAVVIDGSGTLVR